MSEKSKNYHIDGDGNITTPHLHIYRGTNTETKPYPYPCPECGSLTYLGVFIPTVKAFYADYYGWSFHCKNPACAPLYEEDEIDWDDEGEPCEPRKVYDLIDSGAYWSSEDKYYYTPQTQRL